MPPINELENRVAMRVVTIATNTKMVKSVGVMMAACSPVVVGDPVALLAVDSIWEQAIEQPFETGGIIGKFLLEVFESKVLHPVTSSTEERVQEVLHTVKV